MAEKNFAPNLGEVFEVPPSQVNLFRSINSPGYVIGDIAITAAGATYEWDGDSWNSLSISGGGGGAQTPWAQNINGGGFNLTNVGSIAINTLGGGYTLVSNLSGEVVESLVSDVELGYLTGVTSAIQTQLNAKAGLGANTFTALQTITQASANVGILASTGYSLTGSNATSLIDLAGTWNTSGAPTAFKLNITNTGSGSALLMDLQVGGSSKLSVSKSGFLVADSAQFAGNVAVGSNVTLGSNSGGYYWGSGNDVTLQRDAANTLALRNGVNAQRHRVYNTFTTVDTAGEWASIDWITTANVCQFGTFKGSSTGSVRGLTLVVGGTAALTFATTGNATFAFNLTTTGFFIAAAGNGYSWSGRSYLASPADGIVKLSNGAETDFSRLQFGGTTSSFPAWKRSAAELHSRLADDSADASLQALSFKVATVQVLGAQRTGWSAATGGATRTTFDTATVTLPQLAERMKAWLDDALVHGLIGA